MPARKDGVSPGSRKSRDKSSRMETDAKGPAENRRLILLISVNCDFGAKPDPAAEPISQEQRKAPEISS